MQLAFAVAGLVLVALGFYTVDAAQHLLAVELLDQFADLVCDSQSAL